NGYTARTAALARWPPGAPSQSKEGYMSAQQGDASTAQMTLMAPSRATPSPTAAIRRRLTLRVTLQALLLGLLLATVLAVGAVDYVSSRQAVEDLELQLIRAGSQAVARDLEASFAPTLRALQELQLRAEYGRLSLDDRLQLGLVLVDRLRYEYPINRLAYGDQAAGGLA